MRRSKKIYAIIGSFLFLAVLFFPLINDLFNLIKFSETKSENRALATKPAFDISYLDPYPAQYDAYYIDHFNPRRIFLDFYTKMNLRMRKSPYPEKVAIGLNDWLYEAKKEMPVYEGTKKLNQNSIKILCRELQARADYMKEKEIKFYVAFAPMKQEIYPEYITKSYQRTDSTITDKIIKSIRSIKHENLTLIDLKQNLLENKKKHQLYFKYDNHWNSYGAFYAYESIINQIALDFDDIRPYKLNDFKFDSVEEKKGALLRMIGTDNTYSHFKPEYHYTVSDSVSETLVITNGIKHGYPAPKDFPYKYEYEIVKQTNLTDKKKILIIRDSFGGYVIPFLSANFKESVYIFDSWKYEFHQNIIENENPDIVLLFIFEPHIHHILENLSFEKPI